jgi:Exonuclease VII small subunit
MTNNSFEVAMKRLNEITQQLESNELDLDASMVLFEEGLQLVKECDLKLKEFEAKVNQLMTHYSGEENE